MLTQRESKSCQGSLRRGGAPASGSIWAAALLGTNKNMCGGASLVVVGGVMVAGAVVCGGLSFAEGTGLRAVRALRRKRKIQAARREILAPTKRQSNRQTSNALHGGAADAAHAGDAQPDAAHAGGGAC